MPPERRPSMLGRYEVLGDLAAGGMAEILLARLRGPSGFERLLVIKRIFPHLAKDPAFVDMFLDEARTVARIRHPNVVQVHELGRADGDLFLVMEYLEGETVGGLLRRLWSKETRIDPMLAAHVVAETCRGLQAAHDLADDEGTPLGLVHRDVSPQNLFVTYAGAVKVLDFGIAKIDNRSTKTEPGHIKGKYAYMSPEQCAGKNLDRRSDVFSLGIVLHELLTGHRLFARGSEMETLRAVCESPIALPSQIAPATPPALDAICARALARRREERYASCTEMRRDLLAALRAGDEGGDLEVALASLMQSLYPDRIEEKQELLRRARTGQAIGVAPVAEVDGAVELPNADAATVSQITRRDVAPAAEAPLEIVGEAPGPPAPVSLRPADPEPVRRHGGAVALVAIVAVGAAVAGAVALLRSSDPVGGAALPSSAASVAPATSLSSASATPPRAIDRETPPSAPRPDAPAPATPEPAPDPSHAVHPGQPARSPRRLPAAPPTAAPKASPPSPSPAPAPAPRPEVL